MRSLVTGATGFIGRRLVYALCRSGAAVTALSRRADPRDLNELCAAGDIASASADLTQPQSLAGICAGVYSVFHLAGYAHADDASAATIHQDVTVAGTEALIAEAVRAKVARFVFVSSVKAMGEGSAECVDETSQQGPSTAYGEAKFAAEQRVLAAGREHGMHATVLRLPLVYGIGNKGNIPRMLAGIERGWFPLLPDTGNKRSMVWVEDVVQAALLAASRPEANGKTYLVTDGQVYSTRRIQAAIYAALDRPLPRMAVPLGLLQAFARIGDAVGRVRGRRFPLDSLALAKLIGSACYNGDRIVRELGYRPRAHFEAALPDIVADHRRTDGGRASR